MKKVYVFSFLVFAALLSGCQSQKSTQAIDENAAPVVRSNRSYFFDKDLRPAIAVPSASATRSKPTTEPAQSSPSPQTKQQAAAAVPSEPSRQTRAGQSDVVTATVQDTTLVRSQRSTAMAAPASTSTYERKTKVGTELVAVNDTEGGTLKIIYPQEEAGIIQVDKTMPKEVRVGTAFSYVIKVTNLTESMLADVAITETISKDVQFTGAEPTAVTEGNKLVWQIDSLGPKASKAFKVSGIANAAKPLEHKTSITHTVSGSASLNVVQPALKLVRDAPAEAILCEPIPVDFTVSNTGTGAATNVQIVDTLPAGLLTVDGKDRITLDAGTLAAGESRRFSVKVRASKTGVFVFKATATSAAGLKADSEATTTTIRQPVLQITKSGPQRQYLGRSITYEITVLNKGDGPARDTILEDTIPSGVTNVEATSGAQFSGSKLVWELGTLQPTETKKLRVSFTPLQEGDIAATATATAYCAETVTDSIKTAVTGIASCRLEVVDLEDPIEVGSTTTYLITITNQGSAADMNVRVACVLDDKVQYSSSAGKTPGTVMGKTVTFAPLRSLEPKANATWRIVVKGIQVGDARFKVTMSSDRSAVPVEYTEVTHIYQQ